MENENNKSQMTFGRFLAILSVILVFVALICAIVGTVNNQAQDFNSQRNNSYNGGSSSSGDNNTHTHEWRYSYTRPATCTEYGYTVYYCAVCHQEKKDSTSASPLGHNYTSTVVAPTCTEGGYTEHTCSRCGDSYQDSRTSALGHNYTSTVVAPTCTEGGYTERTCKRCGDTSKETTQSLHAKLDVGTNCSICGHSVYSKSNDTVIMSLGGNNLSVEYYGAEATAINDSLKQYVTNVFFADSVTSIGNSAFYGCSSLTSVTIPDGVTSIGSSAFYNCTGLTSVTIGNGVTSIGYEAFCGCSGLTSVTLPDSVTSIGSSAFYDCSGLTSVTMKDELYAYINSFRYTPWYNSLETEEVDGVSYRGKVAMGLASYSGLPPASITIKSGTIAIANSAFFDKDFLTSVTLPDSVTSIGREAFRGCSGLTSITIPDSVTSIGDDAFYYCSGLTSITIPNSVTSIGESAFYYCSELTSITFNGTKEQWNAISKGKRWDYNAGSYTIYCSDGTINKE